MVSAVREDFEFRSVFASRQTSPGVRSSRAGGETYVSTRPPGFRGRARSGCAGALLLFFLLSRAHTRATCLEGLLHVHVCLANVPAALEDLGIDAMAVEQALATAELSQPLDGLRKLSIRPFGIAQLVCDPAQPDVHIGHVQVLVQPGCESQRLTSEFGRPVDVAFLEAQLAQVQQHATATHLEVALVTELERAVEALPGAGRVTARHENQTEIVLRAPERHAVAQDLQQGGGSGRVPGSRVNLAELLVGG